MTPVMAAAIVEAQDCAHLTGPTEAEPCELASWARAALNQTGLALLACGTTRDTVGVVTRAYTLVHKAGESCGWTVASAELDDVRALARVYACMLGMAWREPFEPAVPTFASRGYQSVASVEADPAPAIDLPRPPRKKGWRPPVKREPRDPADLADEAARDEEAWAAIGLGADTGQEGGGLVLPLPEPVHAAGTSLAAPTAAPAGDEEAPPVLPSPVGAPSDDATDGPSVTPAGENTDAPDHRSKPRHRWLDGTVCVRCGESRGAASGACTGKPVEAVEKQKSVEEPAPVVGAEKADW